MYTLDDNGNRIYTLKVRSYYSFLFPSSFLPLQKLTDAGRITKSAHPGINPWLVVLMLIVIDPPSLVARFSPDDKFSRHRVTIKKRFNVLLTQLPAKPM